MIYWNIVQSMISKTAELWKTSMEIVNIEGKIVASSNPARLNIIIPDIKRLLADSSVEQSKIQYLPLEVDNELVGWLCWEGYRGEEGPALLKVALEETLSLDKTIINFYSIAKEEEFLLKSLLDSQAHFQEKKLSMTAMNLGFDLSLPRAVILIYIEPKENAYFNINLQLGYDVVREQTKEEIKKQIRNGLYITAQDLMAYYEDNMLVICKAFLNTEELHRIYQALDVICYNIWDAIKDNRIFSSQVAYGSIVTEIAGLRRSYLEALDLIKLNQYYGKNSGFVKGDEILFESLVHALPGRFIGRYLEPLYQRLVNSGDFADQLLDTVESYIGNNMNIKVTAEKLYMHRNTVTKHIERVEKITGVNLSEGFSNIFLMKMLVIYYRRKIKELKR